MNVVEPGDTVLVGVNGVFGERMTDVAARCATTVVRLDAPWGEPLDTGALAEVARDARTPGRRLPTQHVAGGLPA